MEDVFNADFQVPEFAYYVLSILSAYSRGPFDGFVESNEGTLALSLFTLVNI